MGCFVSPGGHQQIMLFGGLSSNRGNEMRTSVLNIKAEQMESKALEHTLWGRITKQHLCMRAQYESTRMACGSTQWEPSIRTLHGSTVWPFCMRVPLSALEVYCVSIVCENTLYRPSSKTPCGSTVRGLHMRPSHEITFTEFPMETS